MALHERNMQVVALSGEEGRVDSDPRPWNVRGGADE
jgi:hypothetical protein